MAKLILPLLAFVLFQISPSSAMALSREQELVRAGCEQKLIVSAIAFSDEETSSCITHGDKVIHASVVPSEAQAQDLLTFRIRLVLITCKNDGHGGLDFERGCLRNAAVELQKNYAQNSINVRDPILNCPSYEKYWASPFTDDQFNRDCMVTQYKVLGKFR